MTPDYTSKNGKINFYKADCMRLMSSGKTWDLGLTDPNYGIGASRPSKKPEYVLQKNGGKLMVDSNKYTHSSWDDKPADSSYFDLLFSVTKNQIIWGVNYYDYRFSPGRLVWDKINGDSDQMGCEIAYNSLNNRTDIVRFMWSGMIQGKYCGKNADMANKQQGDKRKNQIRIHETEKPIALYRWILQNYAKPGWKILETHGGSMSLAIASLIEGFELDICETEEHHFKNAINRFKIFEQNQTLF